MQKRPRISRYGADVVKARADSDRCQSKSAVFAAVELGPTMYNNLEENAEIGGTIGAIEKQARTIVKRSLTLAWS